MSVKKQKGNRTPFIALVTKHTSRARYNNLDILRVSLCDVIVVSGIVVVRPHFRGAVNGRKCKSHRKRISSRRANCTFHSRVNGWIRGLTIQKANTILRKQVYDRVERESKYILTYNKTNALSFLPFGSRGSSCPFNARST